MGNVIVEKSFEFAVSIVQISNLIREEKKEYVLSKQLLRSGTSIGANVKEATKGQSKPDFRTKMNVALKEASETEYWIELLFKTGYITKEQYRQINHDCVEIIKILTSIVRNSR